MENTTTACFFLLPLKVVEALTLRGCICRAGGDDPCFPHLSSCWGHAGPLNGNARALERRPRQPHGLPLGWEWSCTCSKHSTQTYLQHLHRYIGFSTGPVPLVSSLEEAVYCRQVSCALDWVTGAFQSSLGSGVGFLFLRIDAYHNAKLPS